MGERPLYRRLLDLRPRGGRDVEREVDDEIRAHLQMRVEHLVRRGWDPEEARAEALRRFGDVDQARRQLRATARERDGRVRLREWLASVRQDVTYALRQAGTDPLLVLDLTPNGKDPNGGVLITLCDEGLVLLGGAADAGANRSFQRVR